MTDPKMPEAPTKFRLIKRPAVGWFSVRMLLNTAVQALLTAATGNRTSRREVMAALDMREGDPHPLYDLEALRASGEIASHQGDDAVWVDYVADLGDGFDATHSIAWLMGRDHIGLGSVNAPTAQPLPPDCMTEAPASAFKGAEHVLPGGSVTIFGGDLVYPYATQRLYEERTIGPYYAARPWQKIGDKFAGRMLFSIPGNHDWYDGLANFVHRFCQRGRWMGAWQVQQKRSYFALRLGHGFSIWGIDLATANDFDAAQLEYFRAQADRLVDNEQVVLCVPQPAWTDRDGKMDAAEDADPLDGAAWNAIRLLVDKISNNPRRVLNQASVPVIIAGDKHHYVRHEVAAESQNNACHLITCGGGGAFMLGTDAVSDPLYLNDGDVAHTKTCFPTKAESQSLRGGVFSMFYRHKLFCAALSTVMLSLTWLIQSASQALVGDAEETAIEATALGAVQIGSWKVLSTVGETLIYSPLLLMLTLSIAAGFVGFAQGAKGKRTPRWAAPVAGVLHFFAQLAIAFAIAVLALAMLASVYASLWASVLLMPALTIALSWPICGLVFSLYLWLCNIAFGLHEQEIYSSQSIEDWKSFLRLRIGPEGLTVYPVGLRSVAREWHRSPDPQKPETQETGPDAETASAGLLNRALIRLGVKPVTIEVRQGTTNLLRPVSPLKPHLIEHPITIKPRGTAV